MRYIYNDAAAELNTLFSCVQKDPASWADWRCLHLETLPFKKKYNKPLLHTEITEIIERYFGDKNGTAIFAPPYDIYLFCKNAMPQLLRDVGEQIARHILEKTGTTCGVSMWELASDDQWPMNRSFEGSPPSALGNLQQSTTVLLVEDDPVTRWIVRSTLKGKCTLLTAGTGGAGVDSYRKCQPDLVLLDINLPDKSGQEVMKEIFDGDPKANVVVFTGQGNLETMIEMLEAGAAGFIAKPFTRQRILNCIQKSAS